MADLIAAFLEHLRELQRRLKWIALFLAIFFAASLTIELVPADVGGVPLAYPSFNVFNSTSIQFFNKMVDDLVPPTVNTTVLSPIDGMVVTMKVGLFLAIALSMPVILYHLGAFIAPALRKEERRLILRIIAPATFLFVLGAVFAYLIVLPWTFDFLYAIGAALGEIQLLRVTEFVDFVILFMLAFGLVFELPIIMVGVTALGVVEPPFWKENWRYAAGGILIFGAVITPDGSGVTMFLVALPMSILYIIGYAVSLRFRKRNIPGGG